MQFGYFKGNEGYIRLFKLIKNKYISMGEIKGNIIINKPTLIEKQTLSGLMKKDYSRNLSISINLKSMQKRIDESKFEGVYIIDILKGYFSEEILTKKECINNYNQEFEVFMQYILKQNENTYVYKYLKSSFEQKDKFYLCLKRHYNKNKDTISKDFLNACKGINNLPNLEENNLKLVRIPVFASNILSNPHGFDRKNLCGKLFILLLCNINQVEYPKNSEELAELYYQNNLLIDDVSSMVLCKNILGYEKGNIHKGLQGFCDYNEPIFITLYNLAHIDKIVTNRYKKVVITENPAVFMEIMEKCKLKDFPIICTYGQVKLAGIVLMDLLKNMGIKLYYSGDIDPEGVQIADKLKQRYKDNIELIGFDKDVYLRNLSNITFSENRMKKLNNIETTELKEVCEELKKNKKASYEEKNINCIIKFIENLVID